MPRVGFSAAETPTYGSASSNGGTTREALTRSIPPFYTVSQTDFQRVLGRNLQYMILRAEKDPRDPNTSPSSLEIHHLLDKLAFLHLAEPPPSTHLPISSSLPGAL